MSVQQDGQVERPQSRNIELAHVPSLDVDGGQHHCLDQIASAAAAVLDVPLVLITVIDHGSQRVVGAHGLFNRAMEASVLCRDVAVSSRPIVLQDARQRLPTAARNGWGFELVAYAGVPLAIDNTHVGTLAAFSPQRRNWQSRDLLVLRSLADVVGAVLDMQARSDTRVDPAGRI